MAGYLLSHCWRRFGIVFEDDSSVCKGTLGYEVPKCMKWSFRLNIKRPGESVEPLCEGVFFFFLPADSSLYEKASQEVELPHRHGVWIGVESDPWLAGIQLGPVAKRKGSATMRFWRIYSC